MLEGSVSMHLCIPSLATDDAESQDHVCSRSCRVHMDGEGGLVRLSQAPRISSFSVFSPLLTVSSTSFTTLGNHKMPEPMELELALEGVSIMPRIH